MLEKYFNVSDLHWIIAPHTLDERFLAELERQFGGKMRRLSTLLATQPNDPILTSPYPILVDTIGHLNQLYQFADYAYIGGGFGAGIHNTLEPAAYGIPVLFGPHYQHFPEAVALVQTGGAFCVQDAQTFMSTMDQLAQPARYASAQKAVQTYIHKNTGGTSHVMRAVDALG
jgi:3-deoxy-D-manno-octulosonic-acid transferase